MITLRPYQNEKKAEIFNAWGSNYKNVLLVLPTGMGKCLGVNTPVLMYNGSIKLVQEVNKGDLLMGPDSKPRVVSSTCRGVSELYRITPVKGDSWVCNDVHMLTLKHTQTKKIIDIELPEYVKQNKTFKHCHKQFRVGVSFKHKTTKFDSYLLGIYLAEGTHSQNRITTPEPEVINYLKRWAKANDMRLNIFNGNNCKEILFADYKQGWNKNKIAKLRKACTSANNRWIPKEYLTNTRESRVQLLAGLLDGDGYLFDNCFEIMTKYEQLAEDILYLCRSVGLAAYSKKVTRTIKSYNFSGEYFRINISGNTDIVPTKVERKKATSRKQIKDALNTGLKVQSIGKGNYYGFELDGDGRFLLGDFTVTHNTKLFTSLVIDTLSNQDYSIPTAIMVHRKELVQQICLTFAEEGVPHNIIASRKDIRGIIAAERRMFGKQFYNPSSTVTIISVDTLNSRKDIYKDWVKNIRQWITDEAAHVLKENKWGKAIALFTNARGLGVTATPERLDKKGLGSHVDGVFDIMVEGPNTRWGIEKGFLSKYKIAIPESDYQNYLKSSSNNSDYSKQAMIEASRQSHIIGDVVDNYLKFASGKQAILFASDVKTAQEMEKKFASKGVKAKSLDGTTPDAERLETLIKFREKKLQVLLNVDLFDEGLDVPGIECVIMARPTKSLGKFLQMCLDQDTEILTKRGWLKHTEMNSNDKCAAFNTENNAIEWCKNQEVFVRERSKDEVMFNFKSPHLDIRITSQHDMVSKSIHSKTWIKKTIDETIKRKDTYHIPVNGTERMQDISLTDSELSFIGWMLSDGTRVKAKCTEIIRIYQCSNQISRLNHIRQTLKECGFKYSEYEYERTGELANYDNMIHFTIMKDRPVRNFKGWEGKRGWGELSSWLDKTIPDIYNTLSARQFKVMLHSYFLGDGTKKLNTKDHTPRTMSITCGDNKVMADRLQELCITRGLRCNLAIECRSHINRKDLYMLHIKDVATSSIAGLNIKDGSISGKKPYKRARFIKETKFKKEVVWCVKNKLGTIVTRRNGKVSILGNCGRGLRIAKGKDYMILIDHVGNVTEHGLPCDKRYWTLDRIKKSQKKLNFLRICSNIMCNSPYDRSLTECPWCSTEAITNTRNGGESNIRSLKAVDGDLFLIDPDVIRQLESRTQLEDPGHMAKRVSQAVNAAAGLRAMKAQGERIETQKELITAVAIWAGRMKTYYGYSDRAIHKKFYLYQGQTITEALGQPKAEMKHTIEDLENL